MRARVIASVKKTDKNQHRSAAQQRTSSPTAVAMKFIGRSHRRSCAKIFHKPSQFAQAYQPNQKSAKIAKHAGPSNRRKWTPCHPHVMNQEDSHRQQYRPENKQLRQKSLGGFGKRDIRLKKRDQQRDVPKTDHVRMRVHFRATILEQSADILKSGARRLRVVRRNSTRGRKQVLSDSIRVGMKDKRSKNIAKNHSTEDEPDSADHKNSSRAEGRESIAGLRQRRPGTDCSLTSAHRVFGLAIAADNMAAFKRTRERLRNLT